MAFFDDTRSMQALQVLSVFLLFTANSARGAWDVVPRVNFQAESNDNPRLQADVTAENAEDRVATRLFADVQLQLTKFTPRGDLSVQPMIRTDTYFDHAERDLESTDAFLRSHGSYRWERISAGFSGDFSSERILGTEYLNAQPADIDVEDPVEVDAALLGQNERRRRATLSPYTEIALNHRAVVRLDSRILDVDYEDYDVTSRSGFTDYTLGGAYIRELGGRGSLSVRVFESMYQAYLNRNETDTTGISLGFSRALSSIWSFELTSGIEHSDFQYIGELNEPVRGEGDNFIFAVGFRKRSELSSFNLDFRRHMSPDSLGLLVQRNEFRLSLLRQISPKVEGRVALRTIQTDIDQDTVPGSHDFARFEMGLDWAFTELWSLLVGFQYSGRELGLFRDRASSNSISVGFNYHGRSRRPDKQ